jgi:hypothetical protein
MKPSPPNNGASDPVGASDLEAIIEKVAPERKADFLRWRQRLQRHSDNDELLVAVGYLETVLIATERLARQSPGATQQQLRQEFEGLRGEHQRVVTKLEETTRKVEQSATKIASRTFYLNLGWPFAALGLAFGLGLLAMGVWDSRQEQAKEQARSQTAVYRLARDLKILGGQLDYDTSDDARMLTLKINPGYYKVLLNSGRDADGNAVVILAHPPPTSGH